MNLTKLQLSELICQHAGKGNGLHDLMEISVAGVRIIMGATDHSHCPLYWH